MAAIPQKARVRKARPLYRTPKRASKKPPRVEIPKKKRRKRSEDEEADEPVILPSRDHRTTQEKSYLSALTHDMGAGFRIKPADFPQSYPTLTLKKEKEYWKHFGGLLVRSGVLTLLDFQLLARYCIMMTVFDRTTGNMRRSFREEGAATPSQISKLSQLSSECRKIENDLGLSPLARQRMFIPDVTPPEKDKQEQDNWQALVRKKK